MSFKSRALFILSFICYFSISIHAQVFLRLDSPDDPESIRFYVDSQIEIKSIQDTDTWRKVKIESFLPELNFVVFDQDLLNVNDITAVRIDNSTPKAVGGIFQSFGTVWLGYGAVLGLAGREFTTADALIGVGAFGTGYAIRKIGRYSIYDLSRGYQLRLIDARMVIPEDSIIRP